MDKMLRTFLMPFFGGLAIMQGLQFGIWQEVICGILLCLVSLRMIIKSHTPNQ